jgi:two-component system, NarL family, sensor kinase
MDVAETTVRFVFKMTALLLAAMAGGYAYFVARQRRRYRRLERQFLSAYFDGEEAERKRLAEDLHDDLLNRLNAIAYGLQVVNVADEESRIQLQKNLQDLRSAGSWVRHLIQELGPVQLQEDGLNKGLERFICSLPDSFASRVVLQYDVPSTLPQDLAIKVYRIAQELLTNALKHSDCRHVLLQLQEEKDQVFLYYYDDGCGFSYRRSQVPKGMGLSGLHSRIQSLGGTIYLQTKPGKGTKYYFEIPLKKRP